MAANRPKRVVVVDADNPLVEIQGEFFWREDHDVLVAAAREDGFREGYRTAWADLARSQATAPQQVYVRRPSLFRAVRRIVFWLVLATMFLIVLTTIGEQLLNQR